MHRPRFGSILAAAALATAAVVPLFAAPAGAANTCGGGEFPSTFAAQSGLKVTCSSDAGTQINHIEIHDADNAAWHHGAARAQSLAPASGNAITLGSTTLHFATNAITSADVRRPISAFNSAKASMLAGGTFIKSITNSTTAVLSQKALLTGGTASAPVSSKIEYTNDRVINDAVCSAASTTVTSATAVFSSTVDTNKSVSGSVFPAGTFIQSVTNATTIVLNQATTAACIAGRLTTIGGTTYSGGNPVMFNGDPMTVQLSNSSGGGQGFTCAASQKNLVMTASSITDTGGFPATVVGLPVVVKGGTTVSAKIASRTSSSTVVLSANCPSGISATAGSASVGAPSQGAPVSNAAMMTLAAELNLNVSLVKTQDECAANTFEGFEVIGGWVNPSTAYATNTSTPKASVAQILFPTSVLSFNGFVVPKAGGDTIDANPHYNFSFPLLPTSAAVCLSGGVPQNPTELAFGFNSQTFAAAPFLPTGSGNPSDPPIRQLLPKTGSFTTTIEELTNNTAPNPPTQVSVSTFSCTIPTDTSTNTSCGDG